MGLSQLANLRLNEPSPMRQARHRKARLPYNQQSVEVFVTYFMAPNYTSSPSVDRSALSADPRTRMANRSPTERSVVIVHAT
jgi:hypothetical protein